MKHSEYCAKVESILKELGVPPEIIDGRSLPLQEEPESLELVEAGEDGREHYLAPAAARAWRALRAAASSDRIELHVVSAFRTLERQAEIVRAKRARGLSLETIFCASAPPGYSEHHTGRAVDVATPGAKALEEDFEHTPAFHWLASNAGAFGFTLSFPRGNRYGFVFEPWHWCFKVR